MPEPRSSGNKGTELSRRLSTIERDVIEYTKLIKAGKDFLRTSNKVY
jgi:hypothetical protein